MSVKFKFDEELAVGIIQTTVNWKLAWPRTSAKPCMSSAQDAHAWLEICKAMRALKDGDVAPKIVVLPELSLPRTRLADFEKLVCALNVVAFVGVDYRLNHATKQARNEGMVFIPAGFWKGRPSRNCTSIIFGKSHAAPGEKSALKKLSPSWSHVGDDKVYVFDAAKYGRIGVSICYDFMDLERAVMYRGRVHHLFVLAYNQDLGMFRSLADSLSRTVFCNVVVCNTGFYGGSVAVSSYHAAYRRTLYSHDGNGLFTTQVVKLPVRGVEQALRGKGEKITIKKRDEKVFKDPPPGVIEPAILTLAGQTLNTPQA
jgi:predicted amidohydrolase